MVRTLMVLAITFGVIMALDRKPQRFRQWFGAYGTFAKANLALMAAAGITLDRWLVGWEREVVYGFFLVAGAAGVVWGGLVGRAARQSQSGATGEQPPRQGRAPSGRGKPG